MKFTKVQINDLLDNLRPAKTAETLAGHSHMGSSYFLCVNAPWEDYGSHCEDA